MPPTQRTPYVDLDFDARRLVFRGESYPEDAASFFGPLLQSLQSLLESLGKSEMTVEMEMSYFNSSSAKAFMNMFQLLETAAKSGARVSITWKFAAGDETMEEFGEDFAGDFEHASFKVCAVGAA